MKKLIVLLFVLPLMALITSCDNINNSCSCDGNAEAIVIENVSGTMVRDCQTTLWGVRYVHDSTIDEVSIYLFERIDDEFQTEGMQVSFSGTIQRSTYPSSMGRNSYFCVLETISLKTNQL